MYHCYTIDITITESTIFHIHQTPPPRYRNAARSSRITVQPPLFVIPPTTAKCDVIHKTGST